MTSPPPSTTHDTLHPHNMYPNTHIPVPTDPRIVYTYAERNKEPILQALTPYLQKASRVLELSSGSGQHITHFAASFPHTHFQPSELADPALHASITAYIAPHPNISPPITLNVLSQPNWDNLLTLVGEEGGYDVVYMGNVLHIAPWEVTLAVAQNLHRVVREEGVVVVYGPFKKEGKFTTESNEDFNRTLRERNAEWGLRDIGDVEREFGKGGLRLVEVRDMPANNFLLVFGRAAEGIKDSVEFDGTVE
ncbi:uncharacterized protein EV422DRAFT_166435 [Fimicolochytrium jonesii]|uniref:uncharacterized protein n=1 Tax=Fimicolochytrium jonesii TaxID=1396493 RepID=UPI0022FE7FA1|nr:uncharacterized protein EV422DRAFT_166435 [Fimicolochytrium jonesii]KAI8818818.1 hypothetical protein EV422DRAFT_166435 [Fimicolochytrium jonesii]